MGNSLIIRGARKGPVKYQHYCQGKEEGVHGISVLGNIYRSCIKSMEKACIQRNYTETHSCTVHEECRGSQTSFISFRSD